jgi:hypothetical protein
MEDQKTEVKEEEQEHFTHMTVSKEARPGLVWSGGYELPGVEWRSGVEELQLP